MMRRNPLSTIVSGRLMPQTRVYLQYISGILGMPKAEGQKGVKT